MTDNNQLQNIDTKLQNNFILNNAAFTRDKVLVSCREKGIYNNFLILNEA